MHKISFNAFHLNTFTTHRTAFAVRIIFFNSAVHFSYIYKKHYSFLLRLLRRTLLYHLLPRTTFVREEASRDEALRTTERRAWNIYYLLILLPFFIESFRPFAREASA